MNLSVENLDNLKNTCRPTHFLFGLIWLEVDNELFLSDQTYKLEYTYLYLSTSIDQECTPAPFVNLFNSHYIRLVVHAVNENLIHRSKAEIILNKFIKFDQSVAKWHQSNRLQKTLFPFSISIPFSSIFRTLSKSL